MARIDREIILETPIEKVFAYISEPSNLPEFWPSLIEVKDVQSLPNGGYSARWLYKMVGKRFEGTGEYTRMFPNEFFVIETKGDIKSTITWTFRSRESITKVTFTIEYIIPFSVLSKLAEIMVLKINEQEADLIMANLQAIFSRTSPPNILSRILLNR